MCVHCPKTPPRYTDGRGAQGDCGWTKDAWKRSVTAVGRDFKGKVTLAILVVATPMALVSSLRAYGLYVATALVWLVPDRRIEKSLAP